MQAAQPPVFFLHIKYPNIMQLNVNQILKFKQTYFSVPEKVFFNKKVNCILFQVA